MSPKPTSFVSVWKLRSPFHINSILIRTNHQLSDMFIMCTLLHQRLHFLSCTHYRPDFFTSQYFLKILFFFSFQYYIDKTTSFYVNIINTLLKIRFLYEYYILKSKMTSKTLTFLKIHISIWIFQNNHDRL